VPNLLTTVLKLYQDNTERAALAKIKVASGHDYTKYLLTDESIQLLKEKINLTSDIWQRGQLIRQLETCHNNNISFIRSDEVFLFPDLSVRLEFINNIEQIQSAICPI